MPICLRLGLLGLALGVTAAAGAQGLPSLAGEVTFLEDPTEGDAAIAGNLSVSPGDHVQIVLCYQDDSAFYLLDIAVPHACFYRVADGEVKAISPPGEFSAEPPGTAQPFSVLRRSDRLLFIYEGQVACRGWDGTLAGGKAGYVAAAGKVTDPFVQPLEAINTRDTFMRERDAEHMWTPLCGTWEIQSLRDDDQAEEMEADKSANAFSYQAVSSEGPAISVAERPRWFWTNYRVEASMRSLGGGAMGLVLLAQDEANYLAFRWGSSSAQDEAARSAQIIEVSGGEPTVLDAKPGGFLPEQWYKLTAAYCDGWIVCAIDDVPLLEAFSDKFGCGNPGLYAEGDDGTFFDDVAVEDHEMFREDFSNMVRWEPVQGDWSLTNSGEARCLKAGLLTSGRAAWANYRVEASAMPNRGRLGLQVGRQPDGRAVLYRVALPGAPGGQKAQLLIVGPDGEEPIAERDIQVNGGKTIRLAASIEQGFVKAYLGDEPVIEGFVPACPGGGIGLFADGEKEARFDDVAVTFLRPKETATVTREFTKTSEHPEMAEWASSRAPWVQPPEMKPGATWWTKGDYYGDAIVTFKVRFIGLRDGEVKVTLNGDADRLDEGVHLILGATKGERTVKARVLNGTTEIAQGEVALDSSSCRVRFARQGSHVLVAIDDQPIITQHL